jgi:hypothetical protein
VDADAYGGGGVSETDDLMRDAATFLAAAVACDGETVADTVDAVTVRGPHYTYAFLAGLALLIANAIKRAQGDAAGDGWVPQIVDARTGVLVNAEEAGAGPAFAARFITAAANGDNGLMLDLWAAVVTSGDLEAYESAIVAVAKIAIVVAKDTHAEGVVVA